MELAKIDLREMDYEGRKQALDEWFNHHLHCIDERGHSWASRCWIHELRAWLWGPCSKCGRYRITQVKGNYVSLHPDQNSAQALVANNDFDDIDMALRKIGTLKDLLANQRGF